MTREQLLALIRDAQEFIYHTETCEIETNWRIGVRCTCGMRNLMVRVEDALANHPGSPESSTNDGDDDGN